MSRGRDLKLRLHELVLTNANTLSPISAAENGTRHAARMME